MAMVKKTGSGAFSSYRVTGFFGKAEVYKIDKYEAQNGTPCKPGWYVWANGNPKVGPYKTKGEAEAYAVSVVDNKA